jgi:hypothetical protein
MVCRTGERNLFPFHELWEGTSFHFLLYLRETIDGIKFSQKKSTHAQKLIPSECGSFHQVTHARSGESPSIARQVSAKWNKTGIKYGIFLGANTTRRRICVSNKIRVSKGPIKVLRSRNSSDRIATGYMLDDRGSISCRDNRFISFP